VITFNNQDLSSSFQVKRFFSDSNAAGFYEWHDWSAEKGLERLVFKVSKAPKNLQAHLERIYYCFQEHLDEQLFGALLDLLIVLNNTGLALAKRMIAGSKARLTEIQVATLTDLLETKDPKAKLLTDNRYSIYSKGLQSAQVLVQLSDNDIEQEQDPLILARDFVEFSQLDSAIQVLEKAILIHPERIELHEELLSLYRSTRNQASFNLTYQAFLLKKLILPIEWQQLDDFFRGVNNSNANE
jgi:hypothetical protein